jgi:hypothetical protein
MSRLSRYALALLVLAVMASHSLADSSHSAPQTSCSATISKGVLTLSGQVAGLGNQTRPPVPLTIEATGTAMCMDLPSVTMPPRVVSSTSVAVHQTFPPKNGERKYKLTINGFELLACDAPMEFAYVGLKVCDLTHGTCCAPGAIPLPETK